MSKKTITLQPTDKIFEELGNNTYTFEEALSELIDNSIGSRSKKLEIDVLFMFDNDGVCTNIKIKDNACGISINNIDKCITPCGNANKNTNSLHEHGLGLKAAVSSIGALEYLKSKTINEDGFQIEKFGWELEIEEGILFSFQFGTEISIIPKKNIKRKENLSVDFFIDELALELGARYRYIDDMKIILKYEQLDITNSREVKKVFPYYYNPESHAKAQPIIKDLEFSYGNCSAFLTFGFAPKEGSEYAEIGVTSDEYEKIKSTTNRNILHPYRITSETQGLDLIVNNRVIKPHQLKELGIVSTREQWYNYIRGEIKLKGVKTTTTKNNIVTDKDYAKVLEKISDYIKKGNEKGNLLNHEYIKNTNKHSDNEEILKDRMEANFKMLNFEYEREFTFEAGTKVDFLVKENGENIVHEVKNEQAQGQDVAQTFMYTLYTKMKKGYLYAPSFSSSACDVSKKLKDDYGVEIILRQLPPTI